MDDSTAYTAFLGERLVATGDLRTVLVGVKADADARPEAMILVFDDRTGRQVEFDLRGSIEEVLARVDITATRPGPGRPRLGVVAREVTLLPRHWEWLETRPNGASAALRRLVDEARKREPEKERSRLAKEAAGKAMWNLAGDLPGFEEASRSLFAGDHERFRKCVAGWPDDIREYIERLAEGAWSDTARSEITGGGPR